jgi:hypothetical protein
MLTEEEKRTLVQEGHQVPSQLPLSKSEEKVLKKIRRKIKNKISAQESRRKKKEYVDSLEKRMESCINENAQLRKRLESLEVTNKTLLQRLQSNPGQILDINIDSTNNITSGNQFGTLLMVLVLFFTVLLGVWSPMITKNQLGQASATAATAAAASMSVRNTRSPVNLAGSYSATVGAVAFASIAVAGSMQCVKSESLSPGGGGSNGNLVDSDDGMFSMRPVIVNDVEDEFLASDAILTGQVNNSNLGLMAKSRAGQAVELTKVRPFIRKVPDFSAAINQQHEDAQQNNIIVLTSTANLQKVVANDSTNNSTIPVTNLINNNGCQSQQQQKNVLNLQNTSTISMLNGNSNYRVITNTLQANSNNNKTNLCSNTATKLPTRFRLINNGINAINTHHLTPSVIKMNTLA